MLLAVSRAVFCGLEPRALLMLRAVIAEGGDGVPIMSQVKGLRGVLAAVLTADRELAKLGEPGLDVRKEDPVKSKGGVGLPLRGVLGVRRGEVRRGELLRGVLLA